MFKKTNSENNEEKERLEKLINGNNVRDKNVSQKIQYDKNDTIIIYDLVKTLNQGNSGNFAGRVEMAARQLSALKNAGYDINQIKNHILYRK